MSTESEAGAVCEGTQDALRRLIHEARDRWTIPAISVAVAGSAFGVWSEGFGLSDIENDVPATAATVYRLASISKPITATAIIQLAETGRLDLDAPIQEYVGSFPEKPWRITSRLLLSHLAGIRDVTPGEARNVRHYPYGSVALESFLSAFKDDALLYEPRTKFRYTTHGYNLLGCIIEAASGKDYLTFVRENIFEPVGMTATRADDAQAIIRHRARGYMWNPSKTAVCNAQFADVSDHLPGGGFCATAGDIVRFAAALQSGVLVNSDSLAQILTRQKTTSGQDPRFGLGWFLSYRNGEVEAAHGGKSHGTSTMLYFHVTSGIAVGLLTNLQDVPAPALHSLAQRLADVALGSQNR